MAAVPLPNVRLGQRRPCRHHGRQVGGKRGELCANCAGFCAARAWRFFTTCWRIGSCGNRFESGITHSPQMAQAVEWFSSGGGCQRPSMGSSGAGRRWERHGRLNFSGFRPCAAINSEGAPFTIRVVVLGESAVEASLGLSSVKIGKPAGRITRLNGRGIFFEQSLDRIRNVCSNNSSVRSYHEQ
jgi:hypothetical protein